MRSILMVLSVNLTLGEYMKKLYWFFCVFIMHLVFITACAATDKVYTSDDVSFNNSIAYDRKTKVPITGVIKEFSDSGIVLSENSYKNGKKDGVAKGYFDSGTLMIERHFKKGEVVGVVKVYYESGGLAREQPFKDGKLNGVVKEYSESGALQRETLYKEGKVVPDVEK